jgi:cobalt transporter subunit CbtB
MAAIIALGAKPAVSRLASKAPALALLLFGLIMLYGVGFSTIAEVHNAAHDTRHATGFPCH